MFSIYLVKVLVEPRFANFFLRKLLSLQNYVDDLQTLDRELYTNLIKLKYSGTDISSLGLTFSIDSKIDSAYVREDLIPNGRNIDVSVLNFFPGQGWNCLTDIRIPLS